MTNRLHRLFLAALAPVTLVLGTLALGGLAGAPAAQAMDITDPVECAEYDGRWSRFGDTLEFECSLPTLDGGKECSGSDDCESVCVTHDDEPVGTQTSGHCYDWTITRGSCLNHVSEDVVTGIVCDE